MYEGYLLSHHSWLKKNIAWHETLRGIKKKFFFFTESEQNLKFFIFLLKLNCPVSVKQQVLSHVLSGLDVVAEISASIPVLEHCTYR